jgi:hypothetical protein
MQETKLPLKLPFPVKRRVDTNLNQESITITILFVVLVIPNKILSMKNVRGCDISRPKNELRSNWHRSCWNQKAEFARIKSPPPFHWNTKKKMRKKLLFGFKRRTGTHASLICCWKLLIWQVKRNREKLNPHPDFKMILGKPPLLCWGFQNLRLENRKCICHSSVLSFHDNSGSDLKIAYVITPYTLQRLWH